jgi:predicted ester cyclase
MARDPVQVVRTVEGIWDSGKLDELDDYFASDFRSEATMPGLPPGLEGAKMAHQGTMQAFPDRKVEILDVFGSGEKVAVRCRVTGTNKGGVAAFGVPANGKKIDFEWFSIYTVRKGKIVGHAALNDGMTLLTQLGAIPAPGSPRK